ncbi:hypothetical protein ACWGKS_29170 [Nocardiopsis sp. NPDC055879]|nr:hypothetical protein [Nocardiopsis sp. JB363]
MADVETAGDTTTLTYEDGSTFSSQLMTGYFSWDAEFDGVVFSRNYTATDSGTHTITVDSITNCDPGLGTFYIRLEQDVWYGWDEVGSVYGLDCDGEAATFTGVESGTFRWYLGVNGGSSGDLFGSDEGHRVTVHAGSVARPATGVNRCDSCRYSPFRSYSDPTITPSRPFGDQLGGFSAITSTGSMVGWANRVPVLSARAWATWPERWAWRPESSGKAS